MFWVYAIQNQKGKIYIGQTDNLQKRLDRHNKILPSHSKSFTSKNTGSWKIIYSEIFPTRDEAIVREKQLKSYQGKKFIKQLQNTV